MSSPQRQTVHEKKTILRPKDVQDSARRPATEKMAGLRQRTEVHRQGIALVPSQNDEHPYTAYLIPSREESGMMHLMCDCGNAEACQQGQDLAEIFRQRRRRPGFLRSYEELLNSFWYKLAGVLMVSDRHDVHRIATERDPATDEILVYDSGGDCLIQYRGDSAEDRGRLMERLGGAQTEESLPLRFMALDELASRSTTAPEAKMRAQGFTTRKQIIERGVWYRLGYHVWREYGRDAVLFQPDLEKEDENGPFCIAGVDVRGREIFRLFIDPSKRTQVLKAIRDRIYSADEQQPAVGYPSYRVRFVDDSRLEVTPQVRVTTPEGENTTVDLKEMPHALFGKVMKLKQLGSVFLQQPDNPEDLPEVDEKTVLEGDEVPDFIARYQDRFDTELWDVEESVRNVQIQKKPEELSLFAHALDRNWCWLAVGYQVGQGFVELPKLLEARENGQRFVRAEDGWVDTQEEQFDAVADVFDQAVVDSAGEQLKMSRMQTLKIAAANAGNLQVDGADEESAKELENLVHLRSAESLPDITHQVSPLRPYQETGLKWLKFLADNRFGGLLCDEMGLGKTHQFMALLAVLKLQGEIRPPYLVVCPTTVLMHWKEKIEQHASILSVYVYHGQERNVEEAVAETDVLLTSYGVIRKDAGVLRSTQFGVVAFDEIQHIKNKETQSHRACYALNAEVKFGLTGTPIENRLTELKALFDVILPGYLGDDRNFERQFVQPMEKHQHDDRRRFLHRLVAPFTLRRLKDTVLEELPEKIEDLRHCELAKDQAELYREIVAARAPELRKKLEDEGESVPYVHIFTLIDMLKQICDHPALVHKAPEKFESYTSGKWAAFKEVLHECLDAGEKVVVFSQYLGMLDIMERYLGACGVQCVKLTGQTRQRGDVIRRFNNDPSCRVFLGSLKAGGTGVDLVGGSVVIHYDRWWNAAREQQATDRVHRIGQDRGVQVFKFITRETLEEKIAGIIEKKRNLMENVVSEDQPNVLKTLSRTELMDLLSDPAVNEQKAV